MVEGGDIRAPDRGVGVNDDAGHEDDTAFLEEVFVFEEGVTHDLTDGGANRVAPENLLKRGTQDGAIGLESCDVEASRRSTLSGIDRGHDLGDF